MSGLNQSVKINGALSSPIPLLFEVLQGSVLGPLVFILYTHPFSKLISRFKNISNHLYAHDTQIYITITPENTTTAMPELQSCLESVQSWMNSSKLKLNPDKTEFIVFGFKILRNKLSHLFPVNILGKLLSPSDKVRNLGVIFDSSFRFSAQVSSICDFARIRHFLDKSTAMANALVSSRLDYCHLLLNSISKYDLKQVNSIQYSLCRIIQRTSRFSRENVSSFQVVALTSCKTTY